MSKENIFEVLTASTPIKKWIEDFIASDDPRFAGKSKEERRQMAIGAYYGKKRDSKKERNDADFM